MPSPLRHRQLFHFSWIVLAGAISCSRGAVPREAPGSASRPALLDYTDGLGRPVQLPARPERIVSLAPNITETLFLVGAERQLIGVTRQCDWPPEVSGKLKVGDLTNPSYEVILGAKPDLVIASTAGNDRGAVMKLAALGLPVFVTAPRTVASIFESVRQISRITGHADDGERVLDGMKNRLAAIARRLDGAPRTRAFFVTWFDPLLAPGKGTFENDALRLAGVDSISADVDEFYPRFSLEQVLARDPDVILTVRHSGKALPDLHQVPGWQRLRAVRNGRIYLLDEVLQHPSPRFVDGVEEVARKLYPERFR